MQTGHLAEPGHCDPQPLVINGIIRAGEKNA